MLRTARHVHRQTGHEEPGAGRRRGAELRGQRPDPARGTVRESLDPAGGGRCRRGVGRGPVHLAPAAGKAARAAAAATGSKARSSGPAFSDDEIAGRPGSAAGPSYTTSPATSDLCDEVAALIARERSSAGSRAGWSSARGPWAPAASWATPAARTMQSVMNLKIKFRESFRPFAPIVLREHVDEYFEMRPGEDSPYMLLVAPVAGTAPRADRGPTASGLRHRETELSAARVSRQ